MGINPYESPALEETMVANARNGIWRLAELAAPQQKRIATGFSAMQVAYFMTLFAILIATFRGNDSLILLQGGVATLVGLVIWLTVPGPHRTLSWIATALLIVSMVALAFFAERLRVGQVNGFMKLFGASGLATFLMTHAIVVFLVRDLAIMHSDNAAKTITELVIIALALAAATVSLMSMRIGESFLAGNWHTIAKSAAFFGAAAMALVLRRLIRRFTKDLDPVESKV